MKKLIVFLLALCPLLAFAQSKFDGTWRVKLDNAQLSTKPQVFMLKDGMYSCSTCTPKINVKADGQDQKITGDPYTDTLAVKVVDDHTLQQTGHKDGKVSFNETDSVSQDGNTLTAKFDFQPANSSEPVKGEQVFTRVVKAPAGAHAISGSWRAEKFNSFSDNGLIFTYKATDDGIAMSSPTGSSYDAKFDGKDYPYKGDPGTTSVVLKKINANNFEEIGKRDGKVIYTTRMTRMPDGKSIKIVANNKLSGTTDTFTAVKE
jgi:hypothetical protein